MHLQYAETTKRLFDSYDAILKSVAWNHSRVLYGFNVDIRESGSRIILKSYTNGRAEICFINASSLERCVEVLDAFLHTTSKTGVAWRPDIYFKER